MNLVKPWHELTDAEKQTASPQQYCVEQATKTERTRKAKLEKLLDILPDASDEAAWAKVEKAIKKGK